MGMEFWDGEWCHVKSKAMRKELLNCRSAWGGDVVM